MMRRLIANSLVLLLGAGACVDGARATPGAADRRSIQEMIHRGGPLRQSFENARKAYVQSFDTWKKTGSEADRQNALAKRDAMRQSRAAVKANRDSVIARVDSTYDTREPAGTNVQYDPECSDYGYTSSRCFVRICEPSFTSPEDVATTKIHEFEHVRQKQAGSWGPGAVPQVCTFLYHQLEFDAYEAEMDADFGRRTSLSTDVKLELLQRKTEHLRGMWSDLAVRIDGDKIRRTLPGTEVQKQVTVTNDSELEKVVNGLFSNPAGWPTAPPVFSCVLAADRETTFTLTVHAPLGAELGAGNEVMCEASSAAGVPARDFFFVHVVPVVDVRAGENPKGRPGEWVDFLFTLTNEGPAADQFDVRVASVSGWTLQQSEWLVPLAPGESIPLHGRLLIPGGPPHSTDLLLCTGSSMTHPGQADSGWVYAEIAEASAGADDSVVLAFALLPSAPNPATHGTALRFVLPSRGPVELAIYDVSGRRVRTLRSPDAGALPAGVHTVRWDGADGFGRRVESGVFFVRLRAGHRDAVSKLVVLD